MDFGTEGTYNPISEDEKENVSSEKPIVYDVSLKENNQFEIDDKVKDAKLKIKPITSLEAGIQLLKVTVGTGILFMPSAFKSVGAVQGVTLITFFACITVVLFRMVVKSSRHFAQLDKVPYYTFSEAARRAMLKWPKLKRFASVGNLTVTTCITFSTCSAAIIYILVIAENLRDIFLYVGKWVVPLRVCIALQLPFQLIVNSFTQVKYLTPISLLAIFSLWTGYGFTIYFIGHDIATSGTSQIDLWNHPSVIPEFLGISLFAMNSISAVTMIETNMRKPEKFVSVAIVVMSIVGAFYSGFGMYGYLAYGDATKGPIMLNFAASDTIAFTLKMLISLGLFFSCPIILFEPLRIGPEYLISKLKPPRDCCINVKFFFRWLILVLLILIPLIITDLITILQLLSAVFTILQFIVPVTMDTLTNIDRFHGRKKLMILLRNGLLFIIGICIVTTTFYHGILNVIKYSKGN